MFSNGFEISILIGGKPIPEYYHEAQYFVEGRKGSEYTIRLKNNNDRRAVFVVSVDGLSILNGQQAGNTSPGYVVDARQTLDVACYKVDETTGARFVFGSKEKSYSAEIGEGTENVGVIAALAFLEKPRPVWVPPIWQTLASNSNSRMYSSGALAASAKPTKSASMDTRGRSPSLSAVPVSATLDAEESLGTSFGSAMQWRTEKVTFTRESDYPNGTLVMYYDNKKNLEQRGIEFKKKVPPLPNPFPANPGCPVPKGWHR